VSVLYDQKKTCLFFPIETEYHLPKNFFHWLYKFPYHSNLFQPFALTMYDVQRQCEYVNITSACCRYAMCAVLHVMVC